MNSGDQLMQDSCLENVEPVTPLHTLLLIFNAVHWTETNVDLPRLRVPLTLQISGLSSSLRTSMLLQLWEDNRKCSRAVSKGRSSRIHSSISDRDQPTLQYSKVSMRSPRVEAERAINSEGFWLDPTLAAAGQILLLPIAMCLLRLPPAMLGAGTARCIGDSGGRCVIPSSPGKALRMVYAMYALICLTMQGNMPSVFQADES